MFFDSTRASPLSEDVTLLWRGDDLLGLQNFLLFFLTG